MHWTALHLTQHCTVDNICTVLHSCSLCYVWPAKLKSTLLQAQVLGGSRWPDTVVCLRMENPLLGSFPKLLEKTKNILVPSLAVPHLNEVCNIHNGPVSPSRGSSQCVIFQNCRALNTRHLGVTNGRRGRGHVTRCPPIRGRLAAHQCLRSQDPLPVIVTPAPVSRSRLLTLTRCSHLTRLLLHNAIFWYVLQLPFDNMNEVAS